MRRCAAVAAAVVLMGGGCAGDDLSPRPERNDPFAYDAGRPLDVRETSSQDDGSLRVSTVTYSSPAGGRVPALVVAPRAKGPHAGLILQHGLPGRKEDMLGLARDLAGLGAVVVAIDAPFARRASGEPVLFTRRDRRDQIQLMVDFRRAVDYLDSRDDVEGKRIGYLGISYGGAMGGLLAGIEPRISAFVLAVGDGGLVSHFTGPEDAGGPLEQLAPEARRDWLAAMRPIEPLRWVGKATAPVLFQSGRFDDAVPPRDARAFHRAGTPTKEVRWYDSGHFLPEAAFCDAAVWLGRRLDVDGDAHPAC